MEMQKRLYRSRKEKMFAGIAGGIAEYYELDPVLVRIAFVLVTMLHGAGLIAYIICIFVIPKEPETYGLGAEQVFNEVPQPEREPVRKKSRNSLGAVLVVVGTVLLAANFFPIFGCVNVVPTLLLLAGIALLLTARKGGKNHEA
jgi:phage shock protein PspC (stress-responsive transcriptional regulator)